MISTKKSTRMVILISVLVFSVCLTKPLKATGPIPGARIFNHYVGRGITTPSGDTNAFGYFTFLDGVRGPFFAGAPSEATAFFTFRATPLVFSNISVNGSVLFATFRSPTYKVYFNPSPHGDWTKPDSFSSGRLIATFKRTDGFSLATSFISGKLASSEDFTFNGRTFNFNKLVPFGITDIAPMIDTSFPGFAAVFAGYEVAIGGQEEAAEEE